MCLGGELCLPMLGTKTDGLYSGTEVWEQVFFCSWRYMGLPPAQASKSTGILNCKIKIHQRNLSEPSERLEGIAKNRADEEALLWKELSCAQ